MNRAMAQETVDRLARTFARLLGDAVTQQGTTLAAVAAANDLEQDPNVCRSHDIVDANVVMDAAFAEVTGARAHADSEQDNAVWTAAWNRAKAARFWTDLGSSNAT